MLPRMLTWEFVTAKEARCQFKCLAGALFIINRLSVQMLGAGAWFEKALHLNATHGKVRSPLRN